MADLTSKPDYGETIVEEGKASSRMQIFMDDLELAANTTPAGGGDMLSSNNLSDVDSVPTSRANLGLEIGVDVQAHATVLDNTTASYTTAEETKLAGVETGADVTDEDNVTDALDGATLTAVTVSGTDKVVIQDDSDSDNIKTVTAQSIADLGGGGGLAAACFRESGSTDITGTEADIGLDTTDVANANFSLSSNDITVTDAGTYLICYSIPIADDGSTGGTRAAMQGSVDLDSILINQSRSQDYARETSGGQGVSASFVCSIGASGVITLRITQSGTTDTSTETGQSQLSIVKLA